MKSILTLLSIACLATFSFTGCASSSAQGMQKNCPMTKKCCPLTKKACPTPTSCCAASTGTCPMKKPVKSSAQ